LAKIFSQLEGTILCKHLDYVWNVGKQYYLSSL